MGGSSTAFTAASVDCTALADNARAQRVSPDTPGARDVVGRLGHPMTRRYGLQPQSYDRLIATTLTSAFMVRSAISDLISEI